MQETNVSVRVYTDAEILEYLKAEGFQVDNLPCARKVEQSPVFNMKDYGSLVK